ncbi:MAG TPA: c-type cytochrome biogenesis protein CcmI [Marinagarivorans sp.]
MAFWQGVLILGALGALFILWPVFKLPLTRGLASNPIRRDVTQAALYDEHLEDLDRALKNGDIDQEQYRSLKTELQRTLVSEVEDLSEVPLRPGGKRLLIAMAIVAPLITTFLYFQWGAKPDWEIYQMMQAERDQPAQTQAEYEQFTKELLIHVRSRLKKSPDNHQMRYLLAERSMAIKDYDEAISAYKTLLEVEPGSASIAIKLAQALFVREGNKVTPEVAQYTDIAVKAAPFMYQALEMSGLVAFQNSDYRNAVIYWQRAKQQLDPESRSAQALDGAINKAARAAIAAGQDISSSEEAQKERVAADAAAQGFDVSVTIADGINAQAGDTVFVYARAWQGAKMPLAIQRITVAELPKTLRLDASMAMAPGMDLTTAAELELIARISKSGSPVPQSGDWQGTLGPVSLGDGIVPKSLVISEMVP